MPVTQLAKLANRLGWTKLEDGTIICPTCRQRLMTRTDKRPLREAEFLLLTFRDAAVRYGYIDCEASGHVNPNPHVKGG